MRIYLCARRAIDHSPSRIRSMRNDRTDDAAAEKERGCEREKRGGESEGKREEWTRVGDSYEWSSKIVQNFSSRNASKLKRSLNLIGTSRVLRLLYILNG